MAFTKNPPKSIPSPDVSVIDYDRKFKLGTIFYDSSGMKWTYYKLYRGHGIKFYRWIPDLILIQVTRQNPLDISPS
jgi:hypothetical protein